MTFPHGPVRTAGLSAAGLTPDVVRSSTWESPTHSLHTPVGFTSHHRGRCAALALVLPPDGVFTHVTAALIRGWPLPPQLADAPAIACTDGSAPHHDRRSLYTRRNLTDTDERTVIDGLPVTTAERTLRELAEVLSLLDLVPAMDAALRRGECTVESLLASVRPGRWGISRFCAAIPLADARAESPWETVLRLLHVWSGVAVDPQHVVADQHGQFLAVADLLVVSTRRLVEYDGADHRTAEQHLQDLSRDQVLARARWDRRGYSARHIVRTPHLILQDAFGALQVPLSGAQLHRRLRRWDREVALSSLSATGRARLATRMRRFHRETSPRQGRPSPTAGGASDGAILARTGARPGVSDE